MEGLASDLNLLFDNAKQYNREESKIYKVMTSSYVENSVVGETANDACFDGGTFYSFVGPTVFLGKFCQILHITTEFFFHISYLASVSHFRENCAKFGPVIKVALDESTTQNKFLAFLHNSALMLTLQVMILIILISSLVTSASTSFSEEKRGIYFFTHILCELVSCQLPCL